jgi:hypothetical protein
MVQIYVLGADSILVGHGNVSTGKSDVPQGIIAYNFRIVHWKNNSI